MLWERRRKHRTADEEHHWTSDTTRAVRRALAPGRALAQVRRRELRDHRDSIGEIPDVIAPLVGFRTWRALWPRMEDDHRAFGLYALNYPVLYTPGPTNRAVCMVKRDTDMLLLADDEVRMQWHGPTPDPHCSCGFYAQTEQPALEFRDMARLPEDVDFGFHGIVRLSGRVQVYSRGYRAEVAEVAALFDPHALYGREWLRDDFYHELLTKFAVAYDVPILRRIPRRNEDHQEFAYRMTGGRG